MRLRERLGRWLLGEGERAPSPAQTARPGSSLGRPTYANTLTGGIVLPQSTSFTLLSQYYRSVPVIGRAIDVLSGFVGRPLVESENEALAEEANLWASMIPVGFVGNGIGAWIRDHLAQALLYGYAVGEIGVTARRDDVERLWSYSSPSFRFKARPDGSFDIVQQQIAREVSLNPATSLLTVPQSEGCSPNGRPLFLSTMGFAQGWIDTAGAHRATVRRNGLLTQHVNWQADPNSGFDDPDGSVSNGIREDLESAWNEAMRSQVMEGVTKDFFSTGNTSTTTIGADAPTIDVEVTKRAFVEEIVSASGIPSWMLGYSWSSTERMSQQQADMLLATIDNYRHALTPTLEKIFRTRQTLSLREGEWSLGWSDVNLQDLQATALAEQSTGLGAQAQALAWATRQKVGRQLWTDGVWTQEQYAEAVTGKTEVAVPMEEPPSMAPEVDMTTPAEGEVQSGDTTGSNSLLGQLEWERSLPSLTEHLDEYAERFPVAACNGKHH